MKKVITMFSLLLLLAASIAVNAQDKAKGNGVAAPVIDANTVPADLAKAAVAAMGGDKFKALKNTVMRGSVNLYAPNSAQSLPGQFVIAMAGDKLRIEVAAPPVFAFKQIFDGQNFYSSIPNMQLPPISKFGMSVLTKYDQSGYVVTAIPDKDKLRGFRIADADGNSTDFYIEPATARVKTILIPFNGRTFGTENDKMKDVEGVMIPFKFTMRLETAQGAYFAEYNVKEVKLNQELGADVFEIPSN